MLEIVIQCGVPSDSDEVGKFHGLFEEFDQQERFQGRTEKWNFIWNIIEANSFVSYLWYEAEGFVWGGKLRKMSCFDGNAWKPVTVYNLAHCVLDAYGSADGSIPCLKVYAELSFPLCHSKADLAQAMWVDRKFTDMLVFSEDGKEFSCHRAVLSAMSPVFDRMLSAEMQEGLVARVHLPATASAVECFLRFMYSSEVEAEVQSLVDIEDVFVLADMYEMPELLVLALHILYNSMGTKRVFHTMKFLARFRHVSEDVQKTLNFIIEDVRRDPSLYYCMIECALQSPRTCRGEESARSAKTSAPSPAAAGASAEAAAPEPIPPPAEEWLGRFSAPA